MPTTPRSRRGVAVAATALAMLAVVALPASAAALTASPDPIAFYPQPWYYGSSQQGVNIQSQGAGTQLGSPSIAGPDAAFFSFNYDNCANTTLNAFSSCNLGLNFNPTGPGTKTAQLVVPSDSGGSPLVVPVTATALAGPVVQVTPALHSYGDVAVGHAGTTQVFTISNGGDSPLQIQQAFIVSGIPQAFPVGPDQCTGNTLAPGEHCTFSIGFTPTRTGLAEASIFIISNQPSPVTAVGISGVGRVAPAGAAVVAGIPRAGSRLTCVPQGFGADTGFAFSWLRGAATVPGASGASYVPSDRDIGQAIRCRVVATNSVGGETVTSPPTGAIQPRSLTGLPGAFVGSHTCRTVQVASRVRVGGRTASLGGGQPTIATDPLSIRVPGARALSAAVNGRTVAAGRSRVTIPPRTLDVFADGRVALRVRADGASATTAMVLAPCRLAARLVGGPGRNTAIRVSAAVGLGPLRISLPRSLRLRVGRGTPGFAFVAAAGFPPQTFPLAGAVTRSNDTVVTLTAHGAVVRGLPANTGVVNLFLRPGVVTGRSGPTLATARLLGGGAGQARAAAWWDR